MVARSPIASKWCLEIDSRPATKNYSDYTGSGEYDGLMNAQFDVLTGCWQHPDGTIGTGIFLIPMADLTAGEHQFTLTILDLSGTSSSANTVATIVHKQPTAQWDWQRKGKTGTDQAVQGVVSYGFSSADPISSWCLSIDSKPPEVNLARPRYNEWELSGAEYDKSSGCWRSKGDGLITSGMFVIPTQTLRNGPHPISLTFIDRYGESGELLASLVTRNSTSLRDVVTATEQQPYPSKSAVLKVGATVGNTTRFKILAGTSRRNLRVIKRGTPTEFGQIYVTAGRFKSSSRIYVQIEVAGINGIKRSPIRSVVMPPQLSRPVPTELPRQDSTSRRSSNSHPVRRDVQLVGQDCVLRKSAMSSDWQGQGYSWTIYYIYSNGVRVVARVGFGFEFGSQGSSIPVGCHL